jgi:plastocyanin
MRKILLSILLLAIGVTGYCKKWTIISSGDTFSPATLTINVGDSILFNIGGYHNAVEVSENTWNTNGNYPIPGFSVPYGGGLVLPTKLAVGTHYYVCAPHAIYGMKGIITVQNTTTGIAENQLQNNIYVYPNPTNGKFQIAFGDLNLSKNYNLEIYKVNGERIYKSVISNPASEIDLGNQSKGVYFIKFYDDQSVFTRKIVMQ